MPPVTPRRMRATGCDLAVAVLELALGGLLQDDRLAGAGTTLELRAQGTVSQTEVAGVLDEVPRLDAALELLVVEEVVVDAVHLARARRARGGRDGELELGAAAAQGADEGP